MSLNPIEHVLARLDKRRITNGWGAIAAFSRARLNDLLLEQYRQRLSTLSFLPLFNADVSHEDHIRTLSLLRKIEFGAPLLSFSNASLSDSRAQLTFPIVAGVYTRQSPLAENLLTRFIIDESMGYSLVMEIELRLVTGSVDRRGRVTLDLSEASSFSCNLVEEDSTVNGLIAAAMQEQFKNLPAHRGQFELGMLDFSGYSPLSPTHYRILTQAAPGARTVTADNYGDGAVLMFIQLQANTEPGELPEHSFPYLIPDDRNEDGSERYSATLVVDKELLEHVEDDRLDVLASILFSSAHKFVERDRFTPHDLAIFGNVVAVPPLYSVDPPSGTIRAGESVKFTLRNQAGVEVPASRWSALSRQSHSASGDGVIDSNGLYRSTGLEDIGHHSLTILITAEVGEGLQTHQVSAQLIVQFERVQVAPRVSVFAPRAPIVLGAAMPQDEIQWSLSGATHGALSQTRGNRTQFIADKATGRRQLSVQQVQVQGSQKRSSTLVMLNGLQSVAIEPSRVVGLTPGESVALTEDPALLPEARRRWQLVGQGSLDDAGNYTAPLGNEQGTSVVTCELVQNGVVVATGYSLLEFGEAQLVEAPGWERISSYKVSVPGGADNDTKGRLLNNGFQSLLLQVVIETELVDGKPYRLSLDERATINLTMLTSKQRLVSLNDDQPSGGIEPGADYVWATRQVPNRFELSIARSAGTDATVAANEEATTRQDIYLHTVERPGRAVKMYSTFFPDRDGVESSDDSSGAVGTLVEIIPDPVPDFGEELYTLTRVRVEGGSGDPSDPGDPPFDLWLRTLDYWVFKLRNSRFETLEFLPQHALDPHINRSMIRWESEHVNEVMFSFTGSIFRDKYAKDDAKWQSAKVPVEFDDDLKTLMKSREELATQVRLSNFEDGSLVITNHRVPDFPFVKAGNEQRDHLARDIAVLLRDRQGNAHYRRFAYRSADTSGHRNYIEHTLFTPV